MDNDSHEPNSSTPSPWTLPATRADGWTGERMAAFCETLADTGLVVDACLAAGKSTVGAYALRRRNPLFAAAWEAALTIAREKLADTLLARSIEGTVEQYYKDGELVGERRVIDGRLGLAILRRLDRVAETGSPLHSNLPRLFPGEGRGPGSGVSRRIEAPNWDLALTALRSGEPDAIAEALAMFKGNELNELNDPPIHTPSPSEPEGLDLSDRYWKDDVDEIWMTDFPPPANFDAWQSGPYGGGEYERACTDDEIAIIEANAAADKAAELAEDEELRDRWFALLRGEGDNRHPGLEPGPACLTPQIE